MSSSKTNNLQLNDWSGTDKVSRDEINENFRKIDAASGNLNGLPTTNKSSLVAAIGEVNTNLAALQADNAQLDINVKSAPYNVVGDGIADDTAALNAAFSAASSAGGSVVILPPGKYKITGPLFITGNNVIVQGSGYGSVIYRVNPALTSHGIYVTGNNCIVRDLKIYRDDNNTTWFADKAITFQSYPSSSAGPSLSRAERCYTAGFNYGIYSEQATGIVIDDCDVHNSTFGTNQGTGIALTMTTDIWITRNRVWPLVDYATEHNIYLAGCSYGVVSDNTCKKANVVNIQLFSGTCTNITIAFNKLLGNKHSGILTGESGSQDLTFQDIIIEGNDIEDCTSTDVGKGYGINLTGHIIKNIKIKNNTIKDTSKSSVTVIPESTTGLCTAVDIGGNTFDNWSKDHAGVHHGINIGSSGTITDKMNIQENTFLKGSNSNSAIIWAGTLTNILIKGNNGGPGDYTGIIPYFGVYSPGVINQDNTWNYIAPSTVKPTGTWTKRGVKCLNNDPGAAEYEGWVCVSDNAATDIWKGYGLIET